jgi:hypothetical protein
MTLASAIAIRPDEGTPFLLTFSDSRLTLRSSTNGDPPWTNAVIKSVGLGVRSAVLMAGSTTLPVVTAAEGARGLIANANVNRAPHTMSLLEEARQFLTFHQLAFRSVPDSSSHCADAIIAGFFADGVPGLVHVRNANGSAHLDVYRPRKGDFAVVTIGEAYFAGIATQAIGETLSGSTTGGVLINKVASVFWDIISHEGAPGIGGGLCVGRCCPDNSCWQWPMVTIDGASFYRGLPIEKVPDEWLPSTVTVDHDTSLFAQVERRCPPEGFARIYPPAGDTCEVEWKPTAIEAEILGRPPSDVAP